MWLKRIIAVAVVVGALVVVGDHAAGAAGSSRRFEQQFRCAEAQSRQDARIPKALTMPLPARLTTQLAVLLSPETTTFPPGVLRKIQPGDYSGLWLDSVRLLRSEEGTTMYLLPGVYALPPLPSACRKLYGRSYSRRLERLRKHLNGPVVVLVIVRGESRIGIPIRLKAMETGDANFFGLALFGKREAMYGLVPNDVASVSVTVNGVTTEATVQKNLYLTYVAPLHAGKDTYTVRWLAANGSVIKATSEVTEVLETSFSL